MMNNETLPALTAYERMDQGALRRAGDHIAVLFRQYAIDLDTFNRHWAVIDALLRIMDAANEVVRWQGVMAERQAAYRALWSGEK